MTLRGPATLPDVRQNARHLTDSGRNLLSTPVALPPPEYCMMTRATSTGAAAAWITVDGNEATARIAYALSDVIAIYPITPSSTMGELADAWMAEARPNAWGTVPRVVEMQSEAGAAGALHGALQAGALGTSFTASQGLLLMIPNMFKIAGELLPCVLHVTARAVATHALSIFGDHSDVMAARAAGWALLSSGSVQEAHDLALVAHAATLGSRIPFVHFFDGFRTSHEVAKIAVVDRDTVQAMIDERLVAAHRSRALSPDHPVLRGSAQNPDVFFQSREAANPFYLDCPVIVQRTMDRFAELTGRPYHLFDYEGAPDADRVLVMMGSGTGAAAEAVGALNARGARVGLLKVRLFRPFSAAHFVKALPPSVRNIAVLDRTKEPGATGEPLYVDVVTAISEALGAGEAPFRFFPRIIGGRYGLGSKEFTPAMAEAVFRELDEPSPRTHFTVGIDDDVSFTSLAYDRAFSTEAPDVTRAVFYGVGADGTVGANKNAVKIIGEGTDLFAQGYFVYDSKKSGSTTVSHLRFGPRPIRSTYLIDHAGFVAVHQWSLLVRMNVLDRAADGAILLLNSPYPADQVWNELPPAVQATIARKRMIVYAIDAAAIAAATGTGKHVNTVLQACFFELSGVLPTAEAIAAMKHAAEKTYRRKGDDVVQANLAAIDAAVGGLRRVAIGAVAAPRPEEHPSVPPFVAAVTLPMIAGHGDDLPVSSLPADGTFPVGTARYEKRQIAEELPVWDAAVCIQCNKCAFVCPHAAIRPKTYAAPFQEGAPADFVGVEYRGSDEPGTQYTLQIAPDDCTGCGLCVEVCPARNRATGVKALRLEPARPLMDGQRANWEFFLGLPQPDRRTVKANSVKGTQLLEPLFEFSGACSGCGETPYLKLASQLFGDRMVVANATGCSSIFGGNLPTTPWTTNSDGRGPAWANSLFEDNAEFGYGMRMTIDQHTASARGLLRELAPRIGDELSEAILTADQRGEADLFEQRARVALLKRALESIVVTSGDSMANPSPARRLLGLADYLVRKSVWIVGGDGWAYDIGYGGLDHVLASEADVNILVLDTEVYSNTGGQASKATPRGAVARFASAGKRTAKKDLALLAMTYGHVYVAQVALGGNDTQTVRAFLEAESYPGPSLVIAYAHCIAHGIDVRTGLAQQTRAVTSGHWPLFRFDPRARTDSGFPLVMDSRPPKIPFADYAAGQTRYGVLRSLDPAASARLWEDAQHDIDARWALYEKLSGQNR